MTDGWQVGPDTVVGVTVVVRDGDGEPVDVPGMEEQQLFVWGYGEVLPTLEEALRGATVGTRRRVEVPPEGAFGGRDPERIVEVEAGEFPPGTSVGDRFEAEDAAGLVFVMRILEATDGGFVVDMNHPLADQTVTFELTVTSVRPATGEELDDVTERLMASQQADEAQAEQTQATRAPADGPDEGATDLIAPSRLLTPR